VVEISKGGFPENTQRFAFPLGPVVFCLKLVLISQTGDIFSLQFDQIAIEKPLKKIRY